MMMKLTFNCIVLLFSLVKVKKKSVLWWKNSVLVTYQAIFNKCTC